MTHLRSKLSSLEEIHDFVLQKWKSFGRDPQSWLGWVDFVLSVAHLVNLCQVASLKQIRVRLCLEQGMLMKVMQS